MRAPEFWERGEGVVPTLLSPLASLYDLGGRLRQRLVAPERAGVPVVCVGNLVAGGAGKTPVALAIAGRLAAAGQAVHVLSRGYGGGERGPLRVDPARHGAREVGDEALLLAAVVPTWVARDRPAGARAAVREGARVVVMDDGHQDPALHKDVSLVVVDAAYGMGNGRLIPAGPLREPVAAGLARAQAIVLIGSAPAALAQALARAGGGKPLLWAEIVPAPEGRALAGRRVVAFAGIARPAKFFDTLANMGCEVVARHAFPDHYVYAPDEIMALVEQASGAEARLVTTEKDRVRLPPEAQAMVEALPVAVEFQDTGTLDRVLAPALGHG